MSMIDNPHIRIASAVYPRPRKPEAGRFVANLAEAWSRRGADIEVVSWVTISDRLREARAPIHNVEIPKVHVRSVTTPGMPMRRRLPAIAQRLIDRVNTHRITQALRAGAPPSLYYAQFATAGSYIRQVALSSKQPYFVDLGESYSLVEGTPDYITENRRVVSDATGVFCVSPRLCNEAVSLGADPDRVKLAVNYPDWDRFRPMDKAECRAKLGLDPSAFIVVYVGHYIHRKGSARVNIALHKMQHEAQAAFLGSGTTIPDYPGVIRAASTTHDELPIWLNAADVMALPTLAEGCCNAITEALACALPIITSDIEDVRWQVPDRGVILIDPNDTDALAKELDALAVDPSKVESLRSSLEKIQAQNRGRNRSDEILKVLMDDVSNLE